MLSRTGESYGHFQSSAISIAIYYRVLFCSFSKFLLACDFFFSLKKENYGISLAKRKENQMFNNSCCALCSSLDIEDHATVEIVANGWTSLIDSNEVNLTIKMCRPDLSSCWNAVHNFINKVLVSNLNTLLNY